MFIANRIFPGNVMFIGNVITCNLENIGLHLMEFNYITYINVSNIITMNM